MGYYEDCKVFVQGRRPTTSFQKQYAVRAEYGGRVVWGFPSGGRSKLTSRREPVIPRHILRDTKGEFIVAPTLIEFGRIQEIYNRLNWTPVLGYVKISHLCYLYGSDISLQLMWLVRNGGATLGVNRMGEPVNIKIKNKRLDF